jgi:hypothetical protein
VLIAGEDGIKVGAEDLKIRLGLPPTAIPTCDALAILGRPRPGVKTAKRARGQG